MTPPDVVYLVREGDDNEELRYSLRSLRNMPHGDVWFVGHLPHWVREVRHVRGNPHGAAKALNVYDNLRIACAVKGMPEQIVVMNDDFFVMHPVPRAPVVWRRPLADHVAAISPDAAWWRDSLQAAYDWLVGQGITDPLSYELHTPFPAERSKLGQVLAEAAGFRRATPPQWRTIYGNRWAVGGEQFPDPKVARRDRWDPAAPFLSTDDASFAKATVGEHIRDSFPDPCRYEHRRTP